MALVALQFGDIHPHIDRMAKRLLLEGSGGNLFGRALGEDRVAGVTVLRDDLSVWTLVQPVVTSETAV